MTDSEIDATILSIAEPRWRKIAMIISMAGKKLSLNIHDEHTFDTIHQRVIALVETNQLVAQGDISEPRYSEVRSPSARIGVGTRD